MKGKNNYIPKVGERVLISPPQLEDIFNKYVYTEFDILWISDIFVLYGNKECYPNLHKLEHVSIKKLEKQKL